VSRPARGGAIALFNIGAIAAAVMAYSAFTAPPESPTGFDVAADSSCEVGPRTVDLPATGQHTEKRFYGPGEAPLADFGRPLGDVFVVILYPSDLGSADLKDLQDFVVQHPTNGVLAGAGAQGAIRVLTGQETLTCPQMERSTIEGFSRLWFKSLGYDV
jgi:hypothetical protein